MELFLFSPFPNWKRSISTLLSLFLQAPLTEFGVFYVP